MPLISVVVNTYNSEACIGRSLSSVLNQDPAPHEVIVADDGSSRSVKTLVDELFPDRDVTVVTQQNAGLSAARNLGARSATGDYIVFLDDDDEMLPGAVSEFTRLIKPDRVGIASGGVEVVSTRDGTVHYRVPSGLGPELDHAVADNLAGAFAISRALLADAGGFDEDLKCNHQRELFLRAVPMAVERDLSIVSTREPVLRMHRRPAEERPRNDPERLSSCLEHILAKHRERISKDPDELAALLSNLGVASYRAGKPTKARQHLRDSVRVRPWNFRNWARLFAASVAPVARRVW